MTAPAPDRSLNPSRHAWVAEGRPLAVTVRERIYDGSWTEWGSMIDMPIEHR